MGNLDGRRSRGRLRRSTSTTGERKLAVQHAALLHRRVAGRRIAPLLRGRRLSRLFDGHRPGEEHHAGAGGLVRRRRRRSQHRQAADQRDRLGQRQQARCCSPTPGTSGRCRSTAAPAVNLTVNGKKDAIRYQRRFALEPPEDRDDGIDLSKPQYFARLRRVDEEGRHRAPRAGQDRRDNAAAGTTRRIRAAAEGREGRRLRLHAADVARARRLLRRPTRRSASPSGSPIMRPQVAQFTWTSGVQLVNYTSDKGDKLQAALFLPANYEKGKKYPTLVNIYEKLSQTANTVRGADGQRLQPLGLHEQRLRRVRARHRLPRQRSRACRRCGAWCRR